MVHFSSFVVSRFHTPPFPLFCFHVHRRLLCPVFIAFSPSCFASQEVNDLFMLHSLIPCLRQDQSITRIQGRYWPPYRRITLLVVTFNNEVLAYCHTVTLPFVLEQACACFSDSS